MTPEDIAKKIVSNPNGYTEDSVTVARAYLDLLPTANRALNLAAYHATKRIEAELAAPREDGR